MALNAVVVVVSMGFAAWLPFISLSLVAAATSIEIFSHLMLHNHNKLNSRCQKTKAHHEVTQSSIHTEKCLYVYICIYAYVGMYIASNRLGLNPSRLQLWLVFSKCN